MCAHLALSLHGFRSRWALDFCILPSFAVISIYCDASEARSTQDVRTGSGEAIYTPCAVTETEHESALEGTVASKARTSLGPGGVCECCRDACSCYV